MFIQYHLRGKEELCEKRLMKAFVNNNNTFRALETHALTILN